MKAIVRAGVLSALLICAISAHAQSSSTSYVLQQSTADTGGAPSTSMSYALNASAGQEAMVGTSASPTYVLQSGFWSFVGSGLVPVVLTVERNPLTTDHVDLSWSGNNQPYDVYQATDCTSVFGSLFDQTPDNNYDDIAPPAGLVCYSVLATAPGPVPPPGP